MATEVLDIRVASGVANVVFARPPVSALDVETMQQFTGVFGELAERNDVRVVILTGDGKTFCAGVDRKLFDAPSPDIGARAQFLSAHRAFFVAIREFPITAARQFEVNRGAIREDQVGAPDNLNSSQNVKAKRY